MKSILIVLAAALLFSLGWFLLAESDPLDTESTTTVGSEDEPGKAGTHTGSGNSPDRQIVGAPRTGTPGTSGTEESSVSGAVETDPNFGVLELKVIWGVAVRKPAARVRVLVMARAMRWGPQRVLTTDDEGRLRVERLVPGIIYVKVLRGAEKEFRIRANKTTRGTLAILPGVTVAIEVVDGDEAAVPKATVWLSERWRNNRGSPVGTTDTRGLLTLSHVSPHCNVAVRCPGFEPSKIYPVRGSVGGTVRLRVDLKRGGGMVGGVVVNRRGEPVKGAMVLIGVENPAYSHRVADGSWTPGPPPFLRVTDKQGEFEARTVPSGRLTVQVRHLDYAPWRGQIESTPGVPVSRRITLERGAELFGVTTDAGGEPISFTRVSVGKLGSLAGRMTFADRFGRYELRGLPGGEQTARASRKTSEAEAILRIAIGERLEWNPVLRKSSRSDGKKMLIGKVVDHNNRPLPGWRVAARATATGAGPVGTTTDAGGRFRLVVKWDEMRVWTHAPGEHRGYPPLVRDGVRADDGDILLRVEESQFRSGEIRGKVVDVAGRAVQAQVQAWHVGISLWRSFETDAKTGEFEIKNVPPGKIELKIASDDHAWKQIPTKSLVAGQSIDLGRIVMQAGSRIQGTLTIAGGGTPRNVKLNVYYEQYGSEATVATCTDGRYRTGILPAGSYWMVVMGDHVVTLRTQVGVSEGVETSRDITLQPAALRVLEFEFAAGLSRPRFLRITVRSKTQGLVWNGRLGVSGELRSHVSVAPGDYTLTVWGPGNRKLLKTAFSVANLADAPTMRFIIRPR